jgi:fructuronate reductase
METGRNAVTVEALPAAPPKLNDATLRNLDPARVELPGYDRDRVQVGVVHLGPGAFHRAHQASYFDALLSADPVCGIHAFSLRSGAVASALMGQDGLYTLAMLDAEERFRIIGALLRATAGDAHACADAIAAPATRLVTTTITEKGYCLNASGTLDENHPDIVHDLEAPQAPRSAIGWIALGLRKRFAAKAGGLDVLSCDNLPSNGDKLRGAVIAFTEAVDRDAARFVADEVCFPSSMVDSITPATDDVLIGRVARATGAFDKVPVQREAFSEWVISRNVSRRFPDLASVGATMADDVHAFERAKLRMLNGAHSSLAYVGLARGLRTVFEAMSDPVVAAYVDDLMRLEIAPSLEGRGPDLDAYRRALIARFRNPALAHQLGQIAWDGSQKLPIRLLATLSDNLAAGRPISRLAMGVAAWMRFVRRSASTGFAIVDPMAERLLDIGAQCTDEASADVARFLKEERIFPAALAADTGVRSALADAYGAVQAME